MSEATASTSKSTECCSPASKKIKLKEKSFEQLVDIEKDNALIKRENLLLLLEQEKLKLEIQLLKQKLGQHTVETNDGTYFSL